MWDGLYMVRDMALLLPKVLCVRPLPLCWRLLPLHQWDECAPDFFDFQVSLQFTFRYAFGAVWTETLRAFALPCLGLGPSKPVRALQAWTSQS